MIWKWFLLCARLRELCRSVQISANSLMSHEVAIAP
jgi:hypothetical protein